MADSPVNVSSLGGLFKEAYPQGIVSLVPEIAKLHKDIVFSETERTGNKFHQPVVLRSEQGVSYGGGANAGTAYTLADAIAMSMSDAQLEGSEMTVKSVVAMRVLSKSTGSAKAFRYAMRPILEANMRTHTFRKEVEMLYGRSATGLGQFTSGNADSGTQETLTAGAGAAASASTWAVGLWAGQEGATVNFFNNSGGALISSGADAIFTIASVDPDNRKITVTGTSTGCTALHAVAAAGTVVADFAGARTALATYLSAEGIDYVSTVAGGTTVWNISNTNTLWKPSTYSAASAKLTLGKVLAAANKAVAKAALDEPTKLYVSAATWSDLADSFSASRLLDSSYSTAEGKNGVEKVIYYGSSGVIEVVIHPCVKEGEAFLLPPKRCKRIGSTDVTMNVPGRGDEIFVPSTTVNGVVFSTYSDYQWFTEAPGKLCKITSITNG